MIKSTYGLHQVTYPRPGMNKVTPTHTDLVTKKRPMFSYEEEVRIVFYDKDGISKGQKGIALQFDFENLIESIRVHPEAQTSYYEVVANLIQTYSPNFAGKLDWSDMKLGPPF